MNKNRSYRANLLFRIIVAPAALLCAIFHKPVFQWLTVGALTVWLMILLIDFVRDRVKTHPHRKASKSTESDTTAKTQSDEGRMPDDELFLIRQINGRITEQLKVMYPAVSWLWARRPSAEELRKGGAWRIRVANTDPFNFAEVSLHVDGKLVITMIQAVPLKDTPGTTEFEDQDDLDQSEILERVDVKAWYTSAGEQALAEIIDNLNSQGHHRVLVREDGSVVIRQAGEDEIVDLVRNFPPRMAWEEFSQLLREDDYEADIQPEGLVLKWK